jgi:hypothetical protein
VSRARAQRPSFAEVKSRLKNATPCAQLATQHILPRGFVRIRQFGILTNTRRSALLTLARELLIPAAYYFLFQWAVDSGLRTVDWCGSRPNQMDGVFQHKTLWAAEPKHDPWHHMEVAFFLATAVCLPASIRQQLITRGAGFISTGDYISSAGA